MENKLLRFEWFDTLFGLIGVPQVFLFLRKWRSWFVISDIFCQYIVKIAVTVNLREELGCGHGLLGLRAFLLAGRDQCGLEIRLGALLVLNGLCVGGTWGNYLALRTLVIMNRTVTSLTQGRSNKVSMGSPAIFMVWDPSHKLRAEIALNFRQELLKKVECEMENKLLRFEWFDMLFATNWRPTVFFVFWENDVPGLSFLTYFVNILSKLQSPWTSERNWAVAMASLVFEPFCSLDAINVASRSALALSLSSMDFASAAPGEITWLCAHSLSWIVQ
jgi:hypothetical protein